MGQSTIVFSFTEARAQSLALHFRSQHFAGWRYSDFGERLPSSSLDHMGRGKKCGFTEWPISPRRHSAKSCQCSDVCPALRRGPSALPRLSSSATIVDRQRRIRPERPAVPPTKIPDRKQHRTRCENSRAGIVRRDFLLAALAQSATVSPH